MAVYVVGDFLRETRLRKGYTQEEVSYGICTPASLSRIENGAQKPGRLILEKLFERLGTENNLFNSFVSREDMELYSAIQELIRNILMCCNSLAFIYTRPKPGINCAITR